MNEEKIMDKINKNLKIIDSLLLENGFYKYISKIVNIEDGISQLYDNLEQLKKENEELKKENKKYKQVTDKIDKKLSGFIECCKAEKLESGSDFLHHSYWNMFESFNKQIKEMLKEVEE